MVVVVLFAIYGEPIISKETTTEIGKTDEKVEIEQVEKEPVKQEKKLTWRDNPNDCEPTRIRADNLECLPPEPVAAVARSATTPVVTGCENFRAVTAKYFPADQVDNALFVFSKESGCRHPTPLNATNDSGLCQLHSEYIADLDAHVKRCADKYYGGRIGSNNWSAWYAVCAPNPRGIMLTPIQLYPGIHCS